MPLGHSRTLPADDAGAASSADDGGRRHAETDLEARVTGAKSGLVDAVEHTA